MKNVIAILIDSLNVNSIGTNVTNISCSPFMDEMIKHGVFLSNVYSYAPYTDAATRGMFCGTRTLDNYGYYFSINEEKTNHFRIYHDAGYETIGCIYPYYIYGKEENEAIDLPIYTGGYIFSSVWNGKLVYYANEKQHRPLTDLEYKLIIRCMDYVLDGWHVYYEDLLENDLTGIILLQKSTKEDVKECLQSLINEETLYNSDKKKYVDSILDEGKNHALFKVEKIDIQQYIDQNVFREAYSKTKKEMKYIARVQYKCNMRNNKLFSVKKMFGDVKEFLQTRKINSFRYIANCFMCLNSIKRMQKLSLRPHWQDNSSMKRQVLAAEEALKYRKNKDKPYYLFLHVGEVHNYLNFFPYDIGDEDMIVEEIKKAAKFAKQIGPDFKGNLLYQLAIKHVDDCIKELYDWLKNNNMLDNTVIALFADHGSSYTFDPIRKHVVNCFHTENYNIPLILYDTDKANEEGTLFDKKISAGAMFPTIQYLAGIEDDDIWAKSAYNENNFEDIIITEYMGPGVPDMLNREIWISGRSDKYVIAYKTPINQEFDPMKAFVIYDLINDPRELKDVKMTNDLLENNDIKVIVDKIKERFYQIKYGTICFTNKIDDIIF